MTTNGTRNQGFSLIEMLVVIAIIGIVSAVAVPQISSFTEAANKGKAQRNAQNLVMVSTSAKSAGLNFSSGLTDVSQVLANIIEGSTVSTGAFNGEFFGLPNLQEEQAIASSAYLRIVADTLQYDPAGGNTPISSLPAPSF